MREASIRSVIVVWALLIAVSELHSSHAQLHLRMGGGWKPGGKKRSYPPSSTDHRGQYQRSQHTENQDSPTMTLIHNIAKSLAHRIATQAFGNTNKKGSLPGEWTSGSLPSEDERQFWQWN